MSVVREGRREDADRLPDVEVAAAQLFRTVVDLAWIADESPLPSDDQRRHIDDGTVWVAQDPASAIIGFLTAERVRDALHVHELSVRPEHQRRGVGRALVATAVDAARRRGLHAVTLTTFRDVPWNAPFYERQGFEVLGDPSSLPHVAAALARETRRGLTPHRRCGMRLLL